jgi:hypothetical protein
MQITIQVSILHFNLLFPMLLPMQRLLLMILLLHLLTNTNGRNLDRRPHQPPNSHQLLPNILFGPKSIQFHNGYLDTLQPIHGGFVMLVIILEMLNRRVHIIVRAHRPPTLLHYDCPKPSPSQPPW